MAKTRQPKKKDTKSESMLEQPILNEALLELQKKYRHDAFCKEKLLDVQYAREILKYLFRSEVRELLDLEKLTIDPESYIEDDLKKLYADVVYRIPIKKSKKNIVVFVLFELKTKNNKWTIFQIVKYIIRIWNREWRKAKKEKRLKHFLFPMVIPVIFHHGKTAFTAPTELIKLVQVIADLEPFTLNMKSFLLDVTSLATENMPKDFGLNILFMVLQAVFSNDVAERLLAIFRKLRPKMHLSEVQQEWADALYYATTSAENLTREEYQKVLKQTEKEGVITMPNTLWNQLIAEGRAEGIAEGIAEGEAKATKARQDAVLDVLQGRFKRVPKKIENAVRKKRDTIALKSLVIDAATCQTLDEFATTLY
jgi:predicted transposase/invertase (TIGR01784 family)